MPVSPLHALRPVRTTTQIWVRPDAREWLDGLGLRSACDFLALPGVVVSGHVGRNVSRVELGGTTAYLKREHRVRLRDRFRSWREGFGWASISAREAVVLRHLKAHNLPGPSCLAFGEADGQGFLLVEAADGADLHTLTSAPKGLAANIGRIVSRIHAAGIDQPDLFAKHFLVCPDEFAITILDWQRAILRDRVTWASRVRSLAALRGTISTELFADAAWAELMAAYRNEARDSDLIGQDWEELADRVERAAAILVRKRPGAHRVGAAHVRQELIRIDGETVCAIPEVADLIGRELTIADLYSTTNDGKLFRLSTGLVGLLQSRRYQLPFGRWLAIARGRSWRSPELKAARLLLHLERHGIPAPKLLAYGQVVSRLSASSFVFSGHRSTRPVGRSDQSAVIELLDRLHVAGVRLDHIGPRGEPFSVADDRVVIGGVSPLRLCKRLGRRRAERDRASVEAYFRCPL